VGTAVNGYNLSLTADPSDDVIKWGIGVSVTEDEYLTGLFERTVDGDQKSDPERKSLVCAQSVASKISRPFFHGNNQMELSSRTQR